MKIGILTPGYPSPDSSSYAFVHARAKLYSKEHDVKVFCQSKLNKDRTIEEIEVKEGNQSALIKAVEEFNPDILCIHYPIFSIIKTASKLMAFPQISWIHGHEILLSFNINKSNNAFINIKKKIIIFPRLIIQFFTIRKYLKKVNQVVFVSEWMKTKGKSHSCLKLNDSRVIPNPVDIDVFKYHAPSEIKMKKAVSLRSFTNNKYGLDIAIKAFSSMQSVKLEIFGTGQLFEKLKSLIKETNSNTEIFHKSISHDKVSTLYSNYGFFIAPSRVEAQGVAMCEAMACGLPIIATNIGGIPEFVRDGIDGYLVNKDDFQAIKESIQKLTENKELFNQMSINARQRVINTCSSSVVLEKETSLMKEVLNDVKNIKNK